MDSKIIPVKVAVRCRPMVQKEKNEGCRSCLQIVSNVKQVIVDNNKGFTFDYVYAALDEQQSIYFEAIKPLVDVFFKGYNATVLAYGQTGSGKTYTMGGGSDIGPNLDENVTGVIPRVIRDIFDRIEIDEKTHKFIVKISYLELYKEDIIDLFGKKENQVNIRDDINGGIKLNGLSEIEVTNFDETMKYLMDGTLGRTVASTAMNERSSRSHAIFTIHVEKLSKIDDNDVCKSKFHLVDLAGSERQKKTHAEGDRMKEGININMGLLALGNVISALGEDGTKRSHIPYRDSKLTRLLQDSLGGNSHTLMVACISPADSNLEETISTLRYADRARKIKNKAVINRDPQMAEILRLKQLVSQLQGQGCSTATCDEKTLELIKKLENENIKLTSALQLALNQNMEAEINKEKILNHLNEIKQKTELFNLSMHDAEIQADRTNLVLDLQKTIYEFEATNKENTEEKDFDTNEENKEMCNKHVLKQAELNKELSELNIMLQKKQELANQMLQNEENMKELKNQYEKQIKEMENQIENLQKEKDEILQTMRKDKNDSSLSEKRRKRVNDLEAEMGNLKKKVAEQMKMISIKEQAAKQVEKLNQEILVMKQQKVKLVNKMKEEADCFRKIKSDMEKQVVQLKSQDRKRQVEIAKLEQKHINQQAILKRKSEEAASANNRLKEILMKQKQVIEDRAKKQDSASSSSIGNRIKKILGDEIELQTSIELARFCLEKQIGSRKQLSEQVNTITQKLNNIDENSISQLNITDDQRESLVSSINDLNREIENCSIQITDLQQKLSDIDQGEKSLPIYNQIHTMIEAKVALKWMIQNIVSTNVLCEKTNSQLNEIKQHLEETTTQLETIDIEKKEIKNQYEEQLIQLRKEQEAKILYLLGELKNTNFNRSDQSNSELLKRIAFQQNEITKLKFISEELEAKKVECEKLSKELLQIKYKNALGVTGQLMPTDVTPNDSPDSDFISFSKYDRIKPHGRKKKLVPENGENLNDDETSDPTWHSGYTPHLLRISSNIKQDLKDHTLNKTINFSEPSVITRQMRKRSNNQYTDSDNNSLNEKDKKRMVSSSGDNMDPV